MFKMMTPNYNKTKIMIFNKKVFNYLKLRIQSPNHKKEKDKNK